MKFIITFIVFAFSNSAFSMDMMQELSEDSLSEAYARDGIALDITLRANTNPDGTPYSASPYNNCTGRNNACSLALEFAGRSNQWLVMKDYYYLLSFTDIYIDASRTRSTNTSYRYLDRFKDHEGNVLLSDPNDKPALLLYFPVKSGYQDLYLSSNIGRMAVEFTGHGSCVHGFNCDNAVGSALGFRTSHMNGGAAGINLDGRLYVYGF